MLGYWGGAGSATAQTFETVATTLPGTITGGRERRVAPRDNKHDQIAAAIREQILRGDYTPGEALPALTVLRKAYGAANNTVRQALATLQAEGLVETRPGAGTYVRSFEPIARAGQWRVRRDVWMAGRSPWDVDVRDRDSEVDQIVVDRAPLPEHLARSMQRPAGAEMIRRSRRYLIEKRPTMLAVSYVPLELAAGSRVEEEYTGGGGIWARLAELGHEPVRFSESVRGRPGSDEEVERLRLPASSWVFHIIRAAYAADGSTVEVNEMWADMAKYVLTYEFDA